MQRNRKSRKEHDTGSAFEFFIELFLRRKRKTKFKDAMISEATNSWVTLSDEEKQMFVKKFNEYKLKRRRKFAEKLKLIQPYMKKKLHVNRIQQEDSDSDSTIKLYEDNTYNIPDEIESQEMNLDHNEKNVSCAVRTEINASPSQSTVILDNDQMYPNSEDNEYPTPVLTEPVPPQVRNAKELFELIKNRVGASNLSWSSLTSLDKRHYQKAVLQLKTDYIRNYKSYLESLSPKELFEYYHAFEY